MTALLEVRDLATDILTPGGPRRVVDGLSFDLAAGEVLSLVGESGSGKSIAMLSLIGLLPRPPAIVAGGAARFEGRDLLRLDERALRRIRGNRIGMVFQEPMTALNPVMRVGDQIAETLVAHRGAGWSEARREAVDLLARVRIPDPETCARRYPDTLSGGMRQRVVIAAAIACKPSLLIADEPTTALDATVQAEILALLRRLQEEVGCAILIITHDMNVVRHFADRVLVMRHGRMVESGTAAEVNERPTSPYTQLLVAASRPVPAAPAEAPLPAAERPPPLVVEDVVVSFPQAARGRARDERVFAVDGVSFRIEAGETLALIGESGSGKTTLARAVLGLVPVEAGRILLGGRDVAAAPSGERSKVQMVFQDPQSSLDPRYRAWAAVTEPLAIAGDGGRDRLRARAAELIREVGLDPGHLDRYPHELSGGQRQRLGIARALSISPDLIIADEAVSALDATTRVQVLELFAALQRETGLPFLFITHDLAVVSRIARRVAVMRFGRLVEIGPTEAVLAAPRHPYTRTLVAASAFAPLPAPPASSGHRRGRAGSQPAWRPMESVGPGHLVAAVEEA